MAVAYGIERLNREVSLWMRGLGKSDNGPPVPFLATRGYDSVVWNRLYSRDTSDLDDYQLEQASTENIVISTLKPRLHWHALLILGDQLFFSDKHYS